MSTQYVSSRPVGITIYATSSLFPVTARDGAQAVAADTDSVYVYKVGTGWLLVASPSGVGGVTSLNTLAGAVTLAAGTGITLTPSGNTITIASTGGTGFLKLDGTNSPTATIDWGGQQLIDVASIAGTTGATFNITNVHSVIGHDDGVNGPVVVMTNTFIDQAAGIEFVGGHTAQIVTHTNDFDLSILSLSGRVNILTSAAGNNVAFLDNHTTFFNNICSVGNKNIGSLDGTGTDSVLFGSIFLNSNVKMMTAGGGITIKEGSNARMGVATLSGGTVTVSNTSITANTRVFLTVQSPGGTLGSVYVASRSAGTSFTITSTSVIDTSVVAWLLVEPS